MCKSQKNRIPATPKRQSCFLSLFPCIFISDLRHPRNGRTRLCPLWCICIHRHLLRTSLNTRPISVRMISVMLSSVYLIIFRQKFLYPVRMLRKRLIRAKILFLKDRGLKRCHFIFQTRRQYGKTHNLDQTDIFFFDMMQLCVRMIYAKRMFLGRDVIAQHQIQFEILSAFARNRCDRVVRLSVGLREYKCRLIRIATPCKQDLIRKVDQTILYLFRKYGSRTSAILRCLLSHPRKPLKVSSFSTGAFAIANS